MSKIFGVSTDLFITCRPRQWLFKNVIVFLPLLLSPLYTWPEEAGKLLGMFLIISICASSIYLINDAADREKDAAHPSKSKRPIASGRLPIRLAIAAALYLMVIAVAASAFLDHDALIATCIYLAVATAYTFLLKHTPIVDVLVLGSFYAIRLSAGFAVASYTLGRTFELCLVLIVWLGAIALGLTKRQTEMQALGADTKTRRTLAFYTPGGIKTVYRIIQVGVLPLLAVAGHIVGLPVWLILLVAVFAFIAMYRYWTRVTGLKQDLHPQDVIRLEVYSWFGFLRPAVTASAVNAPRKEG